MLPPSSFNTCAIWSMRHASGHQYFPHASTDTSPFSHCTKHISDLVCFVKQCSELWQVQIAFHAHIQTHFSTSFVNPLLRKRRDAYSHQDDITASFRASNVHLFLVQWKVATSGLWQGAIRGALRGIPRLRLWQPCKAGSSHSFLRCWPTKLRRSASNFQIHKGHGWPQLS